MAPNPSLNEQQVIQGFHLLLKHALSHATQEGLIKADELQSGGADIQVLGPALTLYYAAILSTGTPPSITSPDNSFLLSTANCPHSMIAFFQLWQRTVLPIQSLDNEGRQDLTLLLCEKEARSSPLRADVARLNTDLKTVAIDIAQRRTFAMRFGEDLNHALNANRPRGSGETARSDFVPPPDYVPNPTSHNHDLKVPGESGPSQNQAYDHQQSRMSSSADLPPRTSLNSLPDDPRAGPSSSSSNLASPVPQISPSDMENLSLIRETLFSSFADVFATNPFVSTLFSRGPSWMSRALFATLNLAILEVCESRTTPEGVKAVQINSEGPRIISLQQCPAHLRPFLARLLRLGAKVQEVAREDDERAMKDAENGRETLGISKLERLKSKLVGDDESERGTQEEDRRRESLNDEVAIISNDINRLAIAIIELPSFADRAKSALQVLASVDAL